MSVAYPEDALALVEGRYTVKEKTGCWDWNGKPTEFGYGQIRVGGCKGRTIKAYKYVYEVLVGAVPQGLELDHLCKRPICVNPEHLEPVTHRVNILRGNAPTAKAARATHCSKGHLYDHLNTRYRQTKTGVGRQCRTCAGWTGYEAAKAAESDRHPKIV